MCLLYYGKKLNELFGQLSTIYSNLYNAFHLKEERLFWFWFKKFNCVLKYLRPIFIPDFLIKLLK